MKNLFTLLALLLFAPALFAQVPNAGFETWQTRTGIGITGPFTYEVPQNYELGYVSEVLAAFGMNPNISKSTVANSGSFALRLNASADSIGSDVVATFALPANVRPDALAGFFRTSAAVTDPNDYGHAFVFLTKWNGTSRDTIGFGSADLASSPGMFIPFSAPVSYINSLVPDSAIVYMLYFPEEANSHLIIDDLSFQYLLGRPEENTNLAQFKLFPNPVTENATISFKAASAEKGDLIIRDLTGREISRQSLGTLQAGSHSVPVNTAALKAGIYTATLQTTKSSQTLRFVKR